VSLDDVFKIAPLLLGLGLWGWAYYYREEQRKQWRQQAYHEGIGDEFDQALTRLLEIERFKPKDAPTGPDPYKQALEIARRDKRIMEKNQPPPAPPITVNISHSAGINLGTLIGDLNASVQMLQQQGGQQLAEAIEKLTNAIGNSTEITARDQKELLQFVAGISKEGEAGSPQYRDDQSLFHASDNGAFGGQRVRPVAA
jgi:hypothetical protein